jgi:hypothetical protein
MTFDELLEATGKGAPPKTTKPSSRKPSDYAVALNRYNENADDQDYLNSPEGQADKIKIRLAKGGETVSDTAALYADMIKKAKDSKVFTQTVKNSLGESSTDTTYGYGIALKAQREAVDRYNALVNPDTSQQTAQPAMPDNPDYMRGWNKTNDLRMKPGYIQPLIKPKF